MGLTARMRCSRVRCMNHSPLRLIVLVAVCMASIQSCSASPTVPDFYGVGPADEQSTIGEYYRQEATVFRQRADVMAERATAYRQLFGEESEWVSGARAARRVLSAESTGAGTPCGTVPISLGWPESTHAFRARTPSVPEIIL